MRICGNDKYSIYIRGLDHPPPHCHVRFGDGSEVCVMIPLIEPMYGATISKELRDDIENNLDKLIDEWEKLYPKRNSEVKKKKHSKKKRK